MRYITTSWDDGHPSDERLAGLLEKYNLKGTFYVPQVNPGHEVMNEQEIADLSRRFEIGGHTLGHVNLKGLSPEKAKKEIEGSYHWLTAITGTAPVSFCPPFGAYSPQSLSLIHAAGFRVVRTTELLSPRWLPGMLPTTLQVYEHSPFTYFRHLLKRGRFRNLRLWRGSQFTGDTFRLLDHYIDFISNHGGCLHLWGHSWEIDNNRQWEKLERIFSRISQLPGFSYVENRQLAKMDA